MAEAAYDVRGNYEAKDQWTILPETDCDFRDRFQNDDVREAVEDARKISAVQGYRWRMVRMDVRPGPRP
jgi:hypothetical protein